MSDQCKPCEARGNISKCNDLECSIHDYWYTVHLKQRVAELEAKLANANKRESQLLTKYSTACEQIAHKDRVIEDMVVLLVESALSTRSRLIAYKVRDFVNEATGGRWSEIANEVDNNQTIEKPNQED